MIGTAPPSRRSAAADEARLGWLLVTPAIGVIVLVALFPILWTVWESLHRHDLRMPWLGSPLVGVGNYLEAVADPRFRSALAHTLAFVSLTVPLELLLGLVLALMLDRIHRGRNLVRTVVLLPWAVPTVVGALVWRFIFESPHGVVSATLARIGVTAPVWFADPTAAWLPLVLADAWKTTPFVAVLLLAGLQSIDRSLLEASRVDGAGPWRQLVEITIPLLRPSLLVAFLFRTLDAFRVFDVIYVTTGGGPGTATESLAVYAFGTLLQHLRFGYGAALSVIVFVTAFGFALAVIRLLGADSFEDRRP